MASPDYSVPALDKALDIVELLAGQSVGLGQAAIAERVGRSVGQVFRVLQTLEARGYLLRDQASGLYTLSMMMFELAHRHEPVRGLVAAALGSMRALADEMEQSCNLGMLEGGRILIVAQAESPANFGFRVRVGADFPIETTATGAVLMAFAAPDARPATTALASTAFDRVRERGFERRDDQLQPGITDLVFPVFGRSGFAVAALTVPYVATSFSSSRERQVEDRARVAASEISVALGYSAE
jgi:DNA-binding IclR family transcriptional regulator